MQSFESPNSHFEGCSSTQNFSSALSRFKKALEEYDSKYTTLIDYFCLIGASQEDLNDAIFKAKLGH